jgi:DNA-binding winged helix-turn-helix (wHTH) protein/tetratricopeptide (TPR) repeat protein
MTAKYQRVFAPFRLDPANEQLWRDEEEIPLRRKTFEVLRYLVDRPAQLVTKAELLDTIWAEVVVSDSMPAICVGELRKALGDDSRSPRFVETVHGRGYRFIAPVATSKSSPQRFQPSASAPFVGREVEIAMLRRHLDQVRRGAGGVVLIGGTAGVGKTRLAMELIAEATQGGIFASVGHCYDRTDPVPFIPFVEVLESALERASSREAFRDMLGPDAAEISRLLPQLHRLFPDIPAPMELAPAQSQRMLFHAVGGLLTRLASDTPLLVLLEDLHWADPGTLSLLKYLAREVQNIPVFMVGTYRNNELDSNDPLARTLEELIRMQLVEQVSLSGLPQERVAEMIRSLSGREVSPALMGLMFKTTGGNPFFVNELFRHFIERGKVSDFDNNVRQELTMDQLDLPQSLRLVLGRRLNRVGVKSRSALAAAAVIGRSFPIALLAATIHADPDSLLDWLDEAEEAGLLTSTQQYPEARFHFAHELIRQAVLHDLSAPHRQRVHLQIADAVGQLYPNTLEDWTDDLAHHLWEAGLAAEADRTLKWLKLAAQRALAQGAHRSAIHHLRRGLKVLKRLPPGLERWRQAFELNLSMIAPLIAAEGFGAHELPKAAQRALEACKLMNVNGPGLFTVLGNLSSVHYNQGNLSGAMEIAKQMSDIAESSDIWLLRLWADHTLGFISLALGEYTFARSHLERSLEPYDRDLRGSYGSFIDPGATGLLMLALAIQRLGYPDLALKKALEGLELARDLSHPFTLALVLNYGAFLHLRRGNECETSVLSSENVALCWKHGFEELSEIAILYQGWGMVRRGLAMEGLARIREAITTGRTSQPALRSLQLVVLAAALCDLRQANEGLMVVTEALKKETASERRDLIAWLYQLKGDLLLVGENPEENEAERCFRESILVAQRQSDRSQELKSTIHLARLLPRRSRSAEAHVMLRETYNWFSEGFDTADLKAAKALLDEFNSKAGRHQHNGRTQIA